MSLQEQLFRASFRGVNFFIDGEQETSGGRKTASFLYPNISKRFVEDLGGLPDTFTVKGIIHGDNYISERGALKAALDKGGIGVLVHPFYGSVNVVAKPYTINESMTSLGIATFSMVFEVATDNQFPTGLGLNIPLINQKALKSFTTSLSEISRKFNVVRNQVQSFTAATSSVSGLADFFFGSSAGIESPLSSGLSLFQGAMTVFSQSTVSSIFDPAQLVSNITNSFQSLLGISTTSESSFKSMQQMFNYGDDNPEIDQTTYERVQQYTNQETLKNSVQAAALSQAYTEATNISYQDEEQLAYYKDVLENQYQKIYNNNFLDSDSIEALQDLRNEVRIFFDNIQKEVLQISIIETQTMPITVLAYQYYGDVENYDKLIDLNKISNPSFVYGKVKILTA